MQISKLSENALRQYIDSRTVFEEIELSRKTAKEVRGSMRWKTSGDKEYLVRVATGGAETGMGVRSAETEAIYERFMQRKVASSDRLANLEKEMAACARRNVVEGVGRAPELLVKLLNRLREADIDQHFIVVGTHALYAYEQAAGVRIMESGALATKDVDLLWDTRNRIRFVTQMKLLSSSMLGLLQSIDKSFRLRDDDRYKAVNDKGFEVDILRREARLGGPRTDHEEEFWAVQAKRANDLLTGGRFSAVIASARGEMARMNTIAPPLFVKFKRWMSMLSSREPDKRDRDALQAKIIEEMNEAYFAPRQVDTDRPAA